MAFIHTTAITKQFSIIDEKIQRIMPYTFKFIFISYQCDIALKLFALPNLLHITVMKNLLQLYSRVVL